MWVFVPPPCDVSDTTRVAMLRNHCRVSLQSNPIVHFSILFPINLSPLYISSCPLIFFFFLSLINFLFAFLPLLSKRYKSQLQDLEQQSEQQRETLALLQQEFQRAQAAKTGAPGKAWPRGWGEGGEPGSSRVYTVANKMWKYLAVFWPAKKKKKKYHAGRSTEDTLEG